MFLEKLGLQGMKKFIEMLMVPIALFGTLLSTLHQSSLGAVYLIVPDKLHPLWYSATLPFTFLVSAVMMGLSMVSFESILSSKFFRHPQHKEVLSGLARGSVVAILFYLAVKMYLLMTGRASTPLLTGAWRRRCIFSKWRWVLSSLCVC